MSNLVNNILNNKSTSRNLSLTEINNIIINVVNNVYNPYILYKQNEENKENSLNFLLNNYEYYSRDVILLPGDYIKYFKLSE